jgi:menaquinone-dependent protoporphyrinogen oxidase
MRVLVAYGSKRGGTAGLAEMIRDELTAAGLDAVATPAGDVHHLDGFGAVIVAGALYANRWHRDARRFVRRHRQALRLVPVWLVASGPLNDSAVTTEIPTVRHVAKAIARIGAQGQVTFGGRLAADAKGFPASAMAKTKAGDWRDSTHVHRWATAVASELTGAVRHAEGTPTPP